MLVPSVTQEWLVSVVLGVDGKTALAVGGRGGVLRSTDNGKHWAEMQSGSTEVLYFVTLSTDGKTALAVGRNDTVLRSTDAGQTWHNVSAHSRAPAPWWWTLLALLGSYALALTARQWRRNRTLLLRRGLLDHAVTDRPVDSVAQDRLAFAPLVEALSHFLRHRGTQPPLSVAINAPWGMGKSSLMNMLSARLRQAGSSPVHFNVWHHQHEELLLAPLLNAVIQQGVPSWLTLVGWRFRARLLAIRLRHGGWVAGAGVLALASVPCYLASLFFWPRSAKAVGQDVLDGMVRDGAALVDTLLGGAWLAPVKGAEMGGGLGDVVSAAFAALRADPKNAAYVLGALALGACWAMLLGYLLRPFPARPSILLASLNKQLSLARAEAQTDFRQRFRKHFGDVTAALAPRTMTLFIDDLDRCKPEKAAELLEALNYLLEKDPCFVVLGMAREVVEAQVALAHKALAEEDAALGRARAARLAAPVGVAAGEHATAPDAALDRLRYARKYLRKLVQLDVRLPTPAQQESRALLLGHPVAGGAGDAIPKTPWYAVNWRNVGLVVAMGLVPALLAGLALQVWLTTSTLSNERRDEGGVLLRQVAGFRGEIEAARVYEHWHRKQAETAKAPSSPAATSTLAEPAYRARADEVQRIVKALDTALPQLEKLALDGRTDAFNTYMRQAVAPERNELFRLTSESQQLDGRSWGAILAGMKPTVPEAATKTVAGPRGTATARPTPEERPPSTPAEPVPDEPLPWSLLFWALLPAALLVGAGYRARDSYVVEATPEYERAVQQCLQGLLAQADLASPRELKRFMNFSRYAVARLNSTLPDGAYKVSETVCVNLTAQWQVAQQKAQAGGPAAVAALRQYAADNGIDERDLKLFLFVAGDLGEG